MKITLREVKTGETVEALILLANQRDMPTKKAGWNFTWRTLAKVEGAMVYKLVTVERPEELEGLVMLTLIDQEMLYLNNVEVAPHNYGSDGKYDHVAGGLLAFGCYKSFELGRNYYVGYLSFESKTRLIDLYQRKYGATLAMGQKMFFDPVAGKRLMQEYLAINLEEE